MLYFQVSFGRLLIQEVHDLPPVLAKSLLSPESLTTRLSWEDFVTFDEVSSERDCLNIFKRLQTRGQSDLYACLCDLVRSLRILRSYRTGLR